MLRSPHKIRHSIRTSNGGREIAAFEEETLALRRELQEARASRTLAENHAAKCVNLAVSRSVTPVTYESPDITSTPVRTALTDTRCLSPVPDIIIADTSIPVSIPVSVATSVFRPCSAEVAIPLVIETTQTQARIRMDSGVVVSSDSSPEPQLKVDEIDLPAETTSTSCQPVAINANDTANEIARCKHHKLTRTDSVTDIYSARLANLLYQSFFDSREIYDICYKGNSLEEEKIESSTTNNAQINSDLLMEAAAQADVEPSTEYRNEVEVAIALLESFEKKKNGSPKDASDDTANKVEASSTENANPLESFPATLFGLKKRRKKGHSKSNETNKIRQRADVSSSEITGSCSNARHRCDAMNKNENRFDDDRASRAIAEVPDVAVVGGSSFMPKDLCSTRILTSRVLTAPSRATYTTAYI